MMVSGDDDFGIKGYCCLCLLLPTPQYVNRVVVVVVVFVVVVFVLLLLLLLTNLKRPGAYRRHQRFNFYTFSILEPSLLINFVPQ